jgi:hypothetical protein
MVTKLQETGKQVAELKGKLEETSKKLKSKEDIDADEKRQLTETLESTKTALLLKEKEIKEARITALKSTMAAQKGLPFNYLDYVRGESPEEIESSVNKVMEDFALQRSKIPAAEAKKLADEAAAKARKETEESLKAKGKSTEGNEVKTGYIYSRSEISKMSIDEFQRNKQEIRRQQDEGIIRNE